MSIASAPCEMTANGGGLAAVDLHSWQASSGGPLEGATSSPPVPTRKRAIIVRPSSKLPARARRGQENTSEQHGWFRKERGERVSPGPSSFITAKANGRSRRLLCLRKQTLPLQGRDTSPGGKCIPEHWNHSIGNLRARAAGNDRLSLGSLVSP